MNELAASSAPLKMEQPDSLQRPRHSQPWWLLLVTHLTVLTAGLIYLWRWEPTPEILPRTPKPPRGRTAIVAPSDTGESAVPAPHLIQPDPRSVGSPLAAELNAGTSDGQKDVQVLLSLVRQYSRRLHGRQGLPIGNDSDLARVLTGRNPMRTVILPPNNPAVGGDGRLHDRWGTPYFIHPTGHNQFEVRSAGPDRQMFTEDDLVADPAWQEDENE